jgi:uncharacterized protein involved in response to NO
MTNSSFAPRPASLNRWSWRLFSSEAHRMMFFFGALQAVVAVSWWAIDLGSRYLALYPPVAWMVPSMWAHAWLLLYGLFPFFMFGFLMTAGPNWLGAPKTPAIAYVPAALMMAGGLAVFYVGLLASRSLAGFGAMLHVCGWLWGIGALMLIVARHWSPKARYVLLIFAFLSIGLAGDAIFAVSVLMDDYTHVTSLLHGGVWFFLLPVFIGVATRMVPFFSSRVLGPRVDYRPVWARPALLVGTFAHGLLDLGQLHAWLWLVDLPLAAIVAHLAWRWGLAKSGDVRLLAVLHWSLGMLALAFFLSGGLSLALLAGFVGRVGLGPLHLLVIGYFSAMTLGMVSRVSLGHSGRPLEADRLTWACYLGVLAAAALRVIAEWLAGSGIAGTVMAAAALAWLAAFGVWAWRYLPIYATARVDAQE